MNSKKMIATVLLASILSSNYLPCFAYSFKKPKVIQSQITEYKFQNVNLEWWKNYDDEYLESYIVKAIEENQDLKIATLRVEEANQLVKLQFSKELPNASVGVAPGVLKSVGSTNSDGLVALPMIVNYEADIFLKNHDKTKSAKKAYEVSKLNEKAIYIAVASQIGSTYFNVVKLDKIISVQDSIIKNRKEIYELMKMRNKIGITSTADVVRAQKSYVAAVADMSDLKKTREILLNSLAVMIGESPANTSEFKRISYDELSKKIQIPNKISSEVIVQRPDYQAAEKQVEKAGLDVKIAKKEFLPTINILGLLSFNSLSSLSNSMNWESALAAFGGAAMLPIFTGGAKIANLKLAKNHYEQILQAYYKTNLVAIQEINDALSSLKIDNDKYEKNLESYNLQKKDYDYMKYRYDQGIISNLDLIQQKESLLAINKMVISSKADCYIDQISLYKAAAGKV